MSLGNWARFCVDQMRGEQGNGRLLKQQTYEFLHHGQGGTTSALGWGAVPTALGRQGPVLTHSGSDGNWYALVALLPRSGNGVLVVANAAEDLGGDKAARELMSILIQAIAPPAKNH